MKIRYFGHASFLLTTNSGVRIVFDPYKSGCYGGGIKYSDIKEEVDVVVKSHGHEDHSFTGTLRGNFQVIDGTGRFTFRDVVFNGFPSFHDKSKGAERGKNSIFVVETEGMRVCHLGDLGHLLDDEEVEKLGDIDLLFVPVGGYFTIDTDEALTLTKKINPKIVIPMHFKTPKCEFPIEGPQRFIDKIGWKVVKPGSEFEVIHDTLPSINSCYLMTPSL